MLQNLPYFWDTKAQAQSVIFHFVQLYFSKIFEEEFVWSITHYIFFDLNNLGRERGSQKIFWRTTGEGWINIDFMLKNQLICKLKYEKCQAAATICIVNLMTEWLIWRLELKLLGLEEFNFYTSWIGSRILV